MKTKQIRLGRGINQYQRTYYKETGVLLGLIICFLVMLHGVADYGDERYVAEPEVIPVVQVTDTVLTKQDFEGKIRHYFKRSHSTMIPIAYAESGMTMQAQGWNCFYNKDETIVYETRVKGSHSAACQKSHRVYSWSIDCFLLQKNYVGLKTCPKNVTVDDHLKEVAELSKVCGFKCWSAYNNKSYLAYTK